MSTEKQEEAEMIQLRLTLQGEMARRFMTIKKHWGLDANTDVLRMLITREYEKNHRKKRIVYLHILSDFCECVGCTHISFTVVQENPFSPTNQRL